jgi:hypothetical protein
MNTIGAIGCERQPETRQVAPTKGPFDRERDRHGHRDRDRDSEAAADVPAHYAPNWGTTLAQNVAGRLHKLNVTA